MNATESDCERSRSLEAGMLGHLRALDTYLLPGTDGLTLDVVLASYSQFAAAGLVPDQAELAGGRSETSPHDAQVLSESSDPRRFATFHVD